MKKGVLSAKKKKDYLLISETGLYLIVIFRFKCPRRQIGPRWEEMYVAGFYPITGMTGEGRVSFSAVMGSNVRAPQNT